MIPNLNQLFASFNPSTLMAKGAPEGSLIEPSALLELQNEYLARINALMASSVTTPVSADKRFASADWSAQPWDKTAGLYALNREFMLRMASLVKGSAATTDRVRFFAEQMLDAASPSNFLATNPEAQRLMIETSGESIKKGLENLLGDMQRGRMLQSDESGFEVGKNLGVTAGKVVFRNDLIELICYTSTANQVFERPLLMVPPCINKFYILDLQPENSLVNYMVSQGHQVYMLSWRNAQKEQEHLSWDDYLQQGVLPAITQVQTLSKQKTINALGFCVGGTLLSACLAALAARDEHPVESLTLLTTLLDFSHPGILGIFIDEQHCAYREQTLANGGLMSGKELATTFSFLRPNDLVWNYLVNNYLKGETPPAFDLLYWNADSTNLPGPMFTWYLRNLYLNNKLCEPAALLGMGEPLDLGAIVCPAFIYGSKDDHIVPWQSAYASTQLLGGEIEFALGASGHIAGVINPAHKNKRNYWLSKQMPESPEDWFDSAHAVPGSWWNHWNDWLSPYAGRKVSAKTLPSVKLKSLGAAPGTYVLQRA